VQSLTDHAAYLTENVTFLLDSAVGLINTDQNEIMKVFSVWAVMLMPPTLIGSIYGMNFEHMPELNWVGWAIRWRSVLMVVTMLVPIWWFRRNGAGSDRRALPARKQPFIKPARDHASGLSGVRNRMSAAPSLIHALSTSPPSRPRSRRTAAT
jgi:hypothetical protein